MKNVANMITGLFPKFYYLDTEVTSEIVKSYDNFVEEVLKSNVDTDEEKVKMIEELTVAVLYFYSYQRSIYGASAKSIFDFSKLEDKIQHYMYKNKLVKKGV